MILHRATISSITDEGEVFVEVPTLGIGQDFGPCEIESGTYDIGDRVLVGQVEVAEDVVIVAKMNARTSPDGSSATVQAFYSENVPIANMVGNLWINKANSNMLNFWNGTDWILVRDEGIDGAIAVAEAAQTAAAAAVTAAGNAQNTADAATALAQTKNRTYRQPEEPAGAPDAPLEDGDIWIDSNNGNRLHRWFDNGAGYVWWPVLFGGQAIEFGSIGEDQIDPNFPFPGESDGNPPDISPAPIANGVQGGVSLRWTLVANHDPVTYEVHASYSSTYTADASTKMMETSSSYQVVRSVAGAPISTTQPTYFCLVAKDVDGAAAQSAIVSATAEKLTQDEIDDAFADYLDGIQQSAQNAKTEAENAQTAAEEAQTDATAALANALEAQNTADAKTTTYYQDTAPTGLNDTTDIGNLWFNTATGKVSVWRGSATGNWTTVTDQQIIEALDAAQVAQNTADGKIDSFRAPGPVGPAEGTIGDIWWDTADGDHPYRHDGSTWVSIRDATIAQAAQSAADAFTHAQDALDAAALAQATADGAIRTYYASEPPWATNPDPAVIGDMWFDLDNGQAYRWNGTGWQIITDNAIAEALEAAQSAQATADGKITAYYQNDASVPSDAAPGDILFRLDLQNRLYRLDDTHTWIPLQQKSPDQIDQELQDTIDDFNTSVSTLEGLIGEKGRIWAQPEAPTTPNPNDLWIDTDDGNKPKRYNTVTSQWEVVSDQRIIDAVNDIGALQQNVSDNTTEIETVKITANGKNNIYFSFDPPPSTGIFVGGDTWFQKSNTTLNIIAMYQYDFAETSWFLQELDDAMFNNLDVLSHLQAGSIGTEYLLVGDLTNLAQNPSFEQDFEGWVVDGPFTNISTTYARTGTNACLFTGDGSITSKNSVTVSEGDQFALVAHYRTSTGGPGMGGFRVIDQDGNNLAFPVDEEPDFAAIVGPLTWDRALSTFIVPSGVTEIKFRIEFIDVGETMWIDDLQWRHKATGELIVDGSVKATNIEGKSLTADQMNATFLDAIEVHADNVQAGDLSSNFTLTGEIKICQLVTDENGDLVEDPTSNRILLSSEHGIRLQVPGDLTPEGETDYIDTVWFPTTAYDPDGNRITAMFSGRVTADTASALSLEIQGRAVDGHVSKIMPEAALELGNTINAPDDKPEILFGPKTRNWTGLPSGYTEIGWGTSNGFVVQGRVHTVSGSERVQARFINPTTGFVDHTTDITIPMSQVQGLTANDSWIYVLYKFRATDPFQISRFGINNGIYDSTMIVGGLYNPKRATIGYENGDIWFWKNDSTDPYPKLQQIGSGLANVIRSMNVDINTNREGTAVGNGWVCTGSRIWWLDIVGAGPHPEVSSKSWWSGTGNLHSFGKLPGTNDFVGTNKTQTLFMYNSAHDADSDIRAGYTRIDPNTGNQTLISDVVTRNWTARSFATVIAGPIVPGAADVGIYVGPEAVSGNLQRVTGKTVGLVRVVLSNYPTSGILPPTESSFAAAATPGCIQSESMIPGTSNRAVKVCGNGVTVLYGLTFPTVKRRSNAGQAIASGVLGEEKIDWNVPDHDDPDLPYNSSLREFTAMQAGWYMAVAAIAFTPASGGYRQLSMRVNGIAVADGIDPDGTNASGPSVSDMFFVNAGDKISFWGLHNSGGNLPLRNVDNTENRVAIRRLGL